MGDERRATSLRPITGKSVLAGRNEACPCGSGSKFKKCCGRERIRVSESFTVSCSTPPIPAEPVYSSAPIPTAVPFSAEPITLDSTGPIGVTLDGVQGTDILVPTREFEISGGLLTPDS